MLKIKWIGLLYQQSIFYAFDWMHWETGVVIYSMLQIACLCPQAIDTDTPRWFTITCADLVPLAENNIFQIFGFKGCSNQG